MLDLVIRGGLIVDGSGRSGVGGDLGIRDGRIVEHWQGPDILAMLLDMGLFPPTAEG